LIISLWLLGSACGPKPPNIPVCKDLKQRLVSVSTGHLILSANPVCFKEIGEVECGRCTYIVSGKIFFIGEQKKNEFGGKPWSQIRRESILIPSKESYAPLAAYLINSCKKMGCSDEVTRFKVKIDSLDE
jgi:hypothetical protein